MTFFTDENFIYKANALLEAFDQTHSIRPLIDHFDRGTPDVEWIKQIATWTPKPFVITGDSHIRTRPQERRALQESGLTFFCLARGWTNTAWNEYAWRLIKLWPDIVSEAERSTRPSVFEVTFKKVRRLQNI